MRPTCFVMQPFDRDKFDKRFKDVFSPAIEAAGLTPYRIDNDLKVDIPIEDIERGIKDSRVCFAEITTDNPNVWFELGYAIASGKPVCLVCSKERQAAFPFDVRHRLVLEYSVGSSSDFVEVEKKITERLEALLQKQKDRESIQSLRPTTETAGLTPHEITALAIAISGHEDAYDFISFHNFKSLMDRSGFNETAAGLAIRSLQRKQMIEIKEVQGGWNEENFHAVVATEIGVDWLLTNQEKINLESSPKPARDEQGDEDVPF